jgi:Mn2+/Fe2+ NRAMP family transporter
VKPDWVRFVGVLVVLLLVVFAVVAAVSPPDPCTLLRGVLPGVDAALLVAYLVAIGGGE